MEMPKPGAAHQFLFSRLEGCRSGYEFAADRHRFVIENRLPGQNDFTEFMHGDYRRD